MAETHKSFKRRLWTLTNLKKNGFNKERLLKVYTTMIRPSPEYLSTVYHSMITKADSDELERIQCQALKAIYGWRLSYRRLLEISGLERLDFCREQAFLAFAKKLSNSHDFKHWFPRRVYRHHQPRPGQELFKVYGGTSERYLKSPLNAMRRALNNEIAALASLAPIVN